MINLIKGLLLCMYTEFNLKLWGYSSQMDIMQQHLYSIVVHSLHTFLLLLVLPILWESLVACGQEVVAGTFQCFIFEGLKVVIEYYYTMCGIWCDCLELHTRVFLIGRHNSVHAINIAAEIFSCNEVSTQGILSNHDHWTGFWTGLLDWTDGLEYCSKIWTKFAHITWLLSMQST